MNIWQRVRIKVEHKESREKSKEKKEKNHGEEESAKKNRVKELRVGDVVLSVV